MGKTYKLEILPPAQAELEEIARLHLALSGAKYAKKITDHIFEALEQLTRFPLSGPAVPDPELSAAGYRFIGVDNYLVIYRFFEETIVVYHIPHGAADYPKLFRAF